MPHCIIEYAKDIESHVKGIINASYLGLSHSNLFAENDIKIRAMPFEYYQKGDSIFNDSSSAFIHIRIHILSGRSTKEKSDLSHAVLNSVSLAHDDIKNVSVEIIDIESSSYAKCVTNRDISPCY